MSLEIKVTKSAITRSLRCADPELTGSASLCSISGNLGGCLLPKN
jgi:hypothetical protein